MKDKKFIEQLKTDYLYNDNFLMIMKIIPICWILMDIFLLGYCVARSNKNTTLMIIIINIVIFLFFLILFYCHKVINRVYFDRYNKLKIIKENLVNHTEVPENLKYLYSKYKNVLEEQINNNNLE